MAQQGPFTALLRGLENNRGKTKLLDDDVLLT